MKELVIEADRRNLNRVVACRNRHCGWDIATLGY